jgi:hypothetical protein
MCSSVFFEIVFINTLFLLIRRLEEVEILQAEREAEPLADGGTASEEKVKNLQAREMLLLVSNPNPYPG